MRKIALLIEDNYQVLEAWYPYLFFRGESFETLFVGPGRARTYRSKEGYPAEEEVSIQNADASDFDAVIVPGGYAPDMMRRDRRMVDFVREMDSRNKVVAAICHGPWMLVSAGILQGRKATSFFAIRDDVVNAGAEWTDREVVVDGNLITSRVPGDLPAFCDAIRKTLRKGQ